MPTHASSPSSSTKSAVRTQLRERLLSQPFPALLAGVAQLLTALGYEEVQVAGRTTWRGRNRQGGFDLCGTGATGLLRRTMIAQVKQFSPDTLVFQRSVDELRGVCLRAGAAEAVLITTSAFSGLIQKEALLASPLAPVRLVDGEELLDLLLVHGVGRQGGASQSEPAQGRVDRAAFKDRENESAGKGGSECGNDCKNDGPGAQETVVVTVALRPLSRQRHLQAGRTA